MAPANEVSGKQRRSMPGWWGRRRSGVNVEEQGDRLFTLSHDLVLPPT